MVKRTNEIPPWWPLGREVIVSAIERDDPQTTALLVRMGEQYSANWPEIMFTWIDVLLQAQGIRPESYGKIRPHIHLQNVDTGEIGADVLPDATTWVAALCQARAMDDADAYYDLLRQVDTDEAFGRYVGCLVQCIGITVGNAQRGELPTQTGAYTCADEGHNHDH